MKNGCVYEGNFTNGNMNGKGIYTFTDKRVYEGDFVNNTFEGKGTYSWPNGNKYKGNFKNDKREGFGIFCFNDGRKFRGIWNGGKLEGEYDIFYPERNKWIKRKVKEKEEVHKKPKKQIVNIEKQDEEDIFNQGHIYEGLDLLNLDEIKKDEEIKIELKEDDDF